MREQNKPRKGMLDHPELLYLSPKEKISMLAEKFNLTNAHWDDDTFIVPILYNPDNILRILPFKSTCAEENLQLQDVTKEIDPDESGPRQKYFILEVKDSASVTT